ncbi:peptidylprolyl isomerase [Sphingomonas sp. Leaf407]|uniref:FKBP-type peptidyl-prolyl cis-trans isomerase n=1 Tax=unclassified Sphingomonas TaxID=196159 RepID=UPI0006FEBCEF|nr:MULTISPECIES: FKBP-type peptidyl-prolyl cis-trans isomerase [unclassified Sphingomonas]KQN39717.1 peptidylprolyl isomerase [Sphingomonas sp. Leaf42]KQT28992.1 peptidylprolyl isomerase [Sphingomonas sp. Leaf407]
MSVTAVPLHPVKRGYIVWLWVGIALALLCAVGLAWAGTRSGSDSFLASNASRAGVVTTASGLQYEVLTKGSGPTPTDADVTLVNYVGKFTDDTVFDQSQRPTPMSPKGVVPGFGEALKLMPKGSRYRFWLKPELGYGAPRPAGAPPMSPQMQEMASKVLVFDVEMVDFIPETVLQQLQMQQMMQQQGGGAGTPPPGALPPAGR